MLLLGSVQALAQADQAVSDLCRVLVHPRQQRGHQHDRFPITCPFSLAKTTRTFSLPNSAANCATTPATVGRFSVSH